MKRTLRVFLVIISCVLNAAAQVSISAKAAVLSFTEGDVTIGTRTIVVGAQSISLEREQSIVTGTGRAEVMLNSCVVLHLDENSALHIIDNRLTGTRVELKSGAALVRADGILRDTSVSVDLRGATIPLHHRGVYGIDAAPPRVKVFKGRADVLRPNIGPLRITSGRMADPASAAALIKFKADQERDDFGRWSIARAVQLLIESGFNEAAEREREGRERAWRRAEAAGRVPRGKLPPRSDGATKGRLQACAEASVR